MSRSDSTWSSGKPGPCKACGNAAPGFDFWHNVSAGGWRVLCLACLAATLLVGADTVPAVVAMAKVEAGKATATVITRPVAAPVKARRTRKAGYTL